MFVCTNAKKSVKKKQQMIDRERERERQNVFIRTEKSYNYVLSGYNYASVVISFIQ